MAAGKGSGVPTSPLGQALGKGSGRAVLPGNDPRSLFQSAQAQGLQNLYKPFGIDYQAPPIPPIFGGGQPPAPSQTRRQAAVQQRNPQRVQNFRAPFWSNR